MRWMRTVIERNGALISRAPGVRGSYLLLS